MLHKINPTTTQAWILLKKHFTDQMNNVKMSDLFKNDPERFDSVVALRS